jgi:hypothetical protein
MANVEVIAESGQVRVIKLANSGAGARYRNNYSIECSRCGGVRGVKSRREAAATMLGHVRFCGDVVHQHRHGEGRVVGGLALCGGTDGTITTNIWDVTCADCKEWLRLRGLQSGQVR